MRNSKEIIARRAAQEFHDGDIINLGIGLPEMSAKYIPDDVEVFLQSENGMLGMGDLIFSLIHGTGERLLDVPVNENYVNAGCKYITAKTGACFFDSASSFLYIRGGHVDATVLGALEVDQEGNLANHTIPGKMTPGMGGAMDLVNGAKKVIVVTTHTQKGAPKLKKKITLPATALHCVDMIITELGVMTVEEDGFVLREIHPEVSVEEVLAQTEGHLTIAPDLKVMEV